jgi:zinc protease
MRRTFLFILALTIVTGPSPALAAQKAALTAEQVLDRHVEALGGREVLSKITSTVMKGRLEIPNQGLKGTVVSYAKAPNKKLEVVTIDGVGVQKEVFDGTNGWASDPFNGTRQLSGAELGLLRRGARLDSELNWRGHWKSAELVDGKQVGGRDTYAVKLTPKEGEGTPVTNYYDAETFLLVRSEFVQQTPQGTMPVAVVPSDYRAVEGVMVPFAIDQEVAMMKVLVRFDEAKINAGVEDAMFAKP